MNKNRIITVVFVIIAILLLLYWLFAGTLIEETGSLEQSLTMIGQTN